MDKTRKLTISDLLVRKEQRERDQIEFKRVFVKSLGGELEIRKLPLGQFLDVLDEMDEDMSAGQIMRKQMEIVYECCPIFHNAELQKAYECVEPTDIVGKVLDDNILDVNEILSALFEFYGMERADLMDGMVGQLKN